MIQADATEKVVSEHVDEMPNEVGLQDKGTTVSAQPAEADYFEATLLALMRILRSHHNRTAAVAAAFNAVLRVRQVQHTFCFLSPQP
jgi:hypothetical protein